MPLFMMVEIILKRSLAFTIFEAPPDRDHQYHMTGIYKEIPGYVNILQSGDNS
jgi:hypothetical protein